VLLNEKNENHPVLFIVLEHGVFLMAQNISHLLQTK